MSWYNEPFKDEIGKKYIKRFWMKNGSETSITFIDGATVDCGGVEVKTPFTYEEYQENINGDWRNWFTRPVDPSQDILRQMGKRPSKVAVFTIIDHTEWTDRKGNLHKDEISLYVVKRSSSVWNQIERLISREGSLRGRKFRVMRMGDKSPGAGSLLEYEGEFGLGEDHVPFNYLEILKPKTPEEIGEIFDPQPKNQGGWGSQPPPPPPPTPQQQQGGWGNNQQTPQHSSPQQSQSPEPPQQPPQQYGWGGSDNKVPF